jgi:hypothetical protein
MVVYPCGIHRTRLEPKEGFCSRIQILLRYLSASTLHGCHQGAAITLWQNTTTRVWGNDVCISNSILTYQFHNDGYR